MSEQRPLIPPDPPIPKARATECWKCAIPLESIEDGWGKVLARRCPRCFRVTPNGKNQPTKAPKL